MMKLIFGVLALVLWPSVVFASTAPENVQQVLQKSVDKATAVGQKNSAWERESTGIVQEIQNAELQLEWARFQLEKTERWIAAEQQNSIILEENLQQAQKTRDNLAPFLEVLYADLEAQVAADLPFHQEERMRRLDFIRGTLDDPQAGLSDKLGRLLEAMQVEVDYGYTVDVTEAVMKEGDTQLQTTIFRLGRLALFRLLDNGARAQRYNKVSKNWDELPELYVQEVVHGVEISRKNRVTSILSLPVGTFAELAKMSGSDS